MGFNKKKKKREDVKDDIYGGTYSRIKRNSNAFKQNREEQNEKNEDGFGNSTGAYNYDSFDELRGDTHKSLRKIMDAQVAEVQSNVNDREDAEASNLDTLDRGSRYTRKNNKLKKFKV